MINRHILNWLIANNKIPQVIHLQGVRQAGKTTVMELFQKEYHPNGLVFRLQDLVTLRKYEDQAELWSLEVETEIKKKLDSQEVLHVFVDEIQKIPSLFQAIQGLYDQYKGKVKFWIWGSSASPIKKHKAETLAGRVLSKILWPLSQTEILQTQSVIPLLFNPQQLLKEMKTQAPANYDSFLQRCFEHTLLPELYLTESPQLVADLALSYRATYLENEIRRENLIRDIGSFDQFLSLASHENTEVTHYASVAKPLGISPNTIKNYFEILKDTFVLHLLPAYNRSLRVQLSKSPKTYFVDTGLARLISGQRGVPIVPSSTFGKLFEGFVVNEFLKQIEYASLGWKLMFFRTKKGTEEVDLIVERGDHRIAVEIKSTNALESCDLDSLRFLMENDPSISHAFVVSRQSAPFELEHNIYNVPVWNL